MTCLNARSCSRPLTAKTGVSGPLGSASKINVFAKMVRPRPPLKPPFQEVIREVSGDQKEMAELVANCPRCGARAITVDVKELNLVEKEFDGLKTYEAFAVSCPPRSTSAFGRISPPCRRYGPCRRRMARQCKLARLIKMLVANGGSRDNSRDNNFLHVPMKCARVVASLSHVC